MIEPGIGVQFGPQSQQTTGNYVTDADLSALVALPHNQAGLRTLDETLYWFLLYYATNGLGTFKTLGDCFNAGTDQRGDLYVSDGLGNKVAVPYTVWGANAGAAMNAWVAGQEGKDPITATTTSLPVGTNGTAYNAVLAATGGAYSGSHQYTWALASGTLQNGLSLNTSTGAITGTPTQTASRSLTFTATDLAARSTSTTLTLNVVAGGASFAFSMPTLADATVSKPYTFTLTGASGGTSPYTYAENGTSVLTGLGLSLASGGVFSGTPNKTGIFTISITASDSASHAANGSGVLTIVNNPAPTVLVDALHQAAMTPYGRETITPLDTSNPAYQATYNARVALGNVVYVKSNEATLGVLGGGGSDAAAGAIGTPKLTITAALGVAGVNTVILRKGYYRETFSFNANVTIMSYPSEFGWVTGCDAVTGFVASGSIYAKTGVNMTTLNRLSTMAQSTTTTTGLAVNSTWQSLPIANSGAQSLYPAFPSTGDNIAITRSGSVVGYISYTNLPTMTVNAATTVNATASTVTVQTIAGMPSSSTNVEVFRSGASLGKIAYTANPTSTTLTGCTSTPSLALQVGDILIVRTMLMGVVSCTAGSNGQVGSSGFVFGPNFTINSGDTLGNGDAAPFNFPTNVINAANPMAGYPDRVFIDGRPLQLVSSLSACTPGTFTFFIDVFSTSTATLYISEPPGTHAIEMTTRAVMVNGGIGASSSNAQFIGFGCFSYGGVFNTSMASCSPLLLSSAATGFRIDTMIFSYNSIMGPSFNSSSGHEMTNSIISYNGCLGAHAFSSTNLYIHDNRFQYNNNDMFDVTPSTFASVAAIKLGSCTGSKFLRNIFADNVSAGLWFDTNCDNALVASCSFLRNTGYGLDFEISSGIIAVNNVASANTTTGITVKDWSSNVAGRTGELYNNTSYNNGKGSNGIKSEIFFYDDPRNSNLANQLSLYNNVMAGASSGIAALLYGIDGSTGKTNSTALMVSGGADSNYYVRSLALAAKKIAQLPALGGGTASCATLAQLQAAFAGCPKTETNAKLYNCTTNNDTEIFNSPSTGDYSLTSALISAGPTPTAIPSAVMTRINTFTGGSQPVFTPTVVGANDANGVAFGVGAIARLN